MSSLTQLGFIWDLPDYEFEVYFSLLEKYVAREGHARVPRDHLEENEQLGQWVNRLRGRQSKQNANRMSRLNRLGFVWNTHQDGFERNFSALTKFIAREGHARVPHTHVEDSVGLGRWVTKLRARKNRLTRDQINRLNALSFIWDPVEDSFERRLATLEVFAEREGHAMVPLDHIEGGLKLGVWVNNLRARSERIEPEQRARLNRIGFVWSTLDESFDQYFRLLEAFVAREGHARVPTNHLEAGQPLGNWVNKLRTRRDAQSADRLARLDQIGFIWDPRSATFESYLALFSQFVEREGHALVPAAHREDGVKLGSWVSNLRSRRDKIDQARVERLNRAGFVWDIKQLPR
jgi:hypothetical protein